MAYLEVWKSGRLITRRRVDEQKARKGCRIRLGSVGETRLAVGQSQKIGKFDIRMFEGEPPLVHGEVEEGLSKPQGKVKTRLPLDFSVGTPSLSADKAGLPPDIEGYKIIERLGEGGMGAVWRAEQLSTRREVALKLMTSARFDSAKAQVRFEREVELTARLDHPNIASIYDSGLHHGMYYYAMELIDGMPLDQYIQKKALSQNQILALMRTVCEAIEHAHLRGVMHRDLKPSNIMVSFDGQPHVVDFGLARTFLEEGEALTISVEGEVAGTPAYMSPEQAAGHYDQVDTRTDVYSLGVILYRLLTGQSPYDLSGSLFDVLQRVVQGKIRHPREITKSIDRELEALLLKALAHDQEDRYSSAGALADDIKNYLNREPLNAQVPTTLYFLRKKAHKYRVQVGISLAAFIVLFSIIFIAYTEVIREQTRRRSVEEKAEIQAIELRFKSEELTLAQLGLKILGEDKKEAQAALNLIQEAYTTAHDEISQLNHRLGQRKPPVAVRRMDLRPGAPLASTALVRKPSLPGGIKSWTLETYGHRGRITQLVYSPDGSRLASAGQDGTIRVWDLESGRLAHVLADPNANVANLAWSVDGESLQGTAVADPGRRSVWDIEQDRIRTGGRTRTGVDWHDSSGVCWSAGSQAPARILDEVAGLLNIQLPSAWASRRRSITALAVSPERQQLACGDDDGTIRVLDATSGKVRHTWPAVWCGPIQSICFSPDGQTLATQAGAGTVCLWDADRWEPLRKFETESITHGVNSAIGAIAWATDGAYIARADNRQMIVEILDLHSGDVLRSLSGNVDRITSVSWSPDGRLIAAGTLDGTIHVWDLESDSGVPSVTMTAHSGTVSALEWTPDSTSLITTGHDGKIKIWDSRNETLADSFERQTDPITCSALSRDASVLATGSPDGIIRLWSANSGWTSNLFRTDPNDIEARRSTFTAVAWSPDSQFLAWGDSAGKIRIWSPSSRQWQRTFPANCSSISSLAWSVDGRVLLCGGVDGTVRAWDVMNDFQEHVVLLPLWGPAGPGIAVSSAGDYRGPPGIADRLVYVVQTTEAQMTLSPADFRSQYGWINEPWQVGLYKPGAEAIERIYVNSASEGPYDGKTWDTAFSDLQDALSVAQPNTEIWVAAGIYRPDRGTGARTASFHLKSGVRLLGGFTGTETSSYQRDPNKNETILSGDLKGDDGPDFAKNDENSYHVVTSFRTDPNAVFDGFVITSGNANGPKDPKGPRSKHRCGGALYNDGGNPSLTNCALRHNSAMECGGGIYNGHGSKPKLTNCTFAGNSSPAGGGMVHVSGPGPTLIDCKFIDNRAHLRNAGGSGGCIGGGVCNGGNMTLTNCTFAGNTADLGGGMYSRDGHSPKLTNCKFIGNSALMGGGMYTYNKNRPILANCAFVGNTAVHLGGGMHNQNGSRPILANCVLSGNLAENGAGMINHDIWNDPESNRFFYTSPTLVNCILNMNKADANGGGIWNTEEGKSTLTNCILWGNSDSGGMNESAQIDNRRSDQVSTIDYCCIQGWSGQLGGVGNFGADPLFMDPDGPVNKIGTEDDDLRLKLGSPCIDMGDNAAVPIDTLDLDDDGDTDEPIPFDFEGKPRILNGTVDIGAYESG